MSTGGSSGTPGTPGQPGGPRRDPRAGAPGRERRDSGRPRDPSRDREHPSRDRYQPLRDRGQRFRDDEPRDRDQRRRDRGESREQPRRVPRDRTGSARGTVPPKGAAPAAPRLEQPVRRRTGLLVGAGFAAVLALAGALAWVLLASSLFDTRGVEVLGTDQLRAEDVRAVAAVPLGTPIVRLDTEAVADRVARLRRVATVQVSRTLAGTVRIEVTERRPVVVAPAPDGIHLVDVTGTDYATVAPPPPPGLPNLRVGHLAPGDPATMAALQVLTGLPEPLRRQVLAVRADSPADVVLVLPDDRRVRWGGIELGARKAAVLGPLLTRDGEVYDVSSPDLPTVS